MMKVSRTITKAASEFEVESCKTVADDGGDRRLEERRDQSHQRLFPKVEK